MQPPRYAGVLSLILCGLFITSCGGGSNRVLQSISISPNPAVAKTGSIQLVATGTFSSAPVTVSPLPVNWSPTNCQYCDTARAEVVGVVSVNSAGLATCAAGYSGSVTAQAEAPANPDLPLDAQNVPIVKGTATLTCN